MKLFVCEFITAGGLNCQELPQSLMIEGGLMRNALLNDLLQIKNMQVVTTHDARLSQPVGVISTAISTQDNALEVWLNIMKTCDAIWIVAPETNGVLLKLTYLAEAVGIINLGCGSHAVKLAGSKYLTHHALMGASIATIKTYSIAEFEACYQRLSGAWVVKPDDGAGCDNTFLFSNALDALVWVKNNGDNYYVIQPYQKGVAASISMLCRNGVACVLSCNQQKVVIKNGRFEYKGSLVNGMNAHYATFEQLAQKVAQAMPDLAGYVGVDVILDGEALIVAEINPRLTTSYAALAKSTGINMAKLVLDMFFETTFKFPKMMSHHQQNNMIDISL